MSPFREALLKRHGVRFYVFLEMKLGVWEYPHYYSPSQELQAVVPVVVTL